MAPDRGQLDQAETSISDELLPADTQQRNGPESHDDRNETDGPRSPSAILAERAALPQNFTLRGIFIGLVIGVVVAFSNTYFGLQTGWISGMNMPSVLIGFAILKTLDPYLKMHFHPVENVIIQTVSGSVGTMPLGCGFVGVIPALEFLLRDDERPNGPLNLSLGKLILWAVGICLFGVTFGVPLRKEVIIREKLKYPSGTAAALTIGVLHGERKDAKLVKQTPGFDAQRRSSGENDEQDALLNQDNQDADGPHQTQETHMASEAELLEEVEPTFNVKSMSDWKAKIKLLVGAFSISALYTLFSYFVPQVHSLPVFGSPASNIWQWNFNPSPAYVGQGIIVGPATSMHMLLGCVLGWGILSPLAKYKGWAPGPVDNWETGSKGWIVWISLAIMLSDSIVSLGWLILRPTMHYTPILYENLRNADWSARFQQLRRSTTPQEMWYAVSGQRNLEQGRYQRISSDDLKDTEKHEADAPPEYQIRGRVFWFWLIFSVALYFISIHLVFSQILPVKASVVALLLSAILSIMGVRALGETDLNPVSGISKLTQLIFAAFIPNTNPNATIINLIAGAVSESAAVQAGDLMQDLKTGHLLGASPAAQFNGQIIGSLVGAVVSAAVYKLYVRVYPIPGDLFQVPTGFVWVFTARLVTGRGLPPKATVFAIGAAAIWAVLTALRTKHFGEYVSSKYAWARKYPFWQSLLPGGIAVAVGMYNTPSFTLARAIGGLITWWWVQWRGGEETSVIVLASGLILGEGLFSIVNLGLASAGVVHA